MKILTSLITAMALFVSSVITAQEQTITATVTNVTSNQGKVSFALHNKTTFMKTPLQAASAKIVNGVSTVTFKNVAAGEYAIICFHDKNENDMMDFESNGMPKEDYGASNNIMSYGPPQYDNAKFLVTDKNLTLKIKF